MDLAFARCPSQYLMATHSDVFVKRRDVLTEYRALMAKSPVVGYQMSPRNGEHWKKCPSHTLTMFHMPTMRQHGISWNITAASEHFRPKGELLPVGMIDTETWMGETLSRAGIVPHFLGGEMNWQMSEDHRHVHCRSFQGSRAYGYEHYNKALRWVKEKMAEAEARILEWR
jgi:hypothetical protein